MAFPYFVCRISGCERTFGTATARGQHERSNRHKRCPLCNESHLSWDDLPSHERDVHGYCSETQCQVYFGTYRTLQEHRQTAPGHFFCPGPAGPGCDPNHPYTSTSNLRAHRESSAHVQPTMHCVWDCCERGFVSVAAVVAHYDANGCPAITRDELNRHLFDIDRQRLRHLVDGAQSPLGGAWHDARIEGNIEEAVDNGEFICRQKHCNLSFRSFQQLRAHLKSPVHDPFIYRCQHCLKRFQTISGLAGHIFAGTCGVDSESVGSFIPSLVREACLRHQQSPRGQSEGYKLRKGAERAAKISQLLGIRYTRH